VEPGSHAEPFFFSLETRVRKFPNLDGVTAEITRLSGGWTLSRVNSARLE
jgi:hypothetical protein